MKDFQSGKKRLHDLISQDATAKKSIANAHSRQGKITKNDQASTQQVKLTLSLV